MTKLVDKEPSKMVEGSGVVESPATLSLYIKQYIHGRLETAETKYWLV
jgi:hypothetical protein